LIFGRGPFFRQQKFGLALQYGERRSDFVRCIGHELPELFHHGVDASQELIRIEAEHGCGQQ